MNTATLNNHTLNNTDTASSNKRFGADVLRGLTASPKYLESKYFYDAVGDDLFQQIMESPEYYLTNCEMEVFTQQTKELANALMPDDQAFDLIELGAGDASKSVHLLSYLLKVGAQFAYLPIDISSNVITMLDERLSASLPGLDFRGLNGEYFEMLDKAKALSTRRKVVLFLGSNIGNMLYTAVEAFCAELRAHLTPGDIALIGFDLKKHPLTILNAYNDKAGVTRRFNLNLLHRINQELGANFDINAFEHYPTYDPETGACKSFLISKQAQQVRLPGHDEPIAFAQNEYINMEISLKFTEQQTRELALAHGFKPLCNLYDSKQWFTDAMWMAV